MKQENPGLFSGSKKSSSEGKTHECSFVNSLIHLSFPRFSNKTPCACPGSQDEAGPDMYEEFQ
ncbi:hypothetical protein D187_008664 [Cystobacter fuscus DSM 2262]|uniref:Uncharacterized protein n=1 Tax=Cystobacter fuscus (strain ATCC 25194 / DSM 2262 / NBRC 100088 / M29) TaxID=1242864 RepID=S9PHC2_CYSF2|nr:hypothetical protein D187_008664 [Cystobacter fuscus DSM 2262]